MGMGGMGGIARPQNPMMYGQNGGMNGIGRPQTPNMGVGRQMSPVSLPPGVGQPYGGIPGQSMTAASIPGVSQGGGGLGYGSIAPDQPLSANPALGSAEGVGGVGSMQMPRMMDTGPMLPPQGPQQAPMTQTRQLAPGRSLLFGGTTNPDGTVSLGQQRGGMGGMLGDYMNPDGSMNGFTGTRNNVNIVNDQVWHPSGLSQGTSGPDQQPMDFNNWLRQYLPQYAQGR